jgi:hypothetical protein
MPGLTAHSSHEERQEYETYVQRGQSDRHPTSQSTVVASSPPQRLMDFAVREQVRARAGDRSEYCRLGQA